MDGLGAERLKKNRVFQEWVCHDGGCFTKRCSFLPRWVWPKTRFINKGGRCRFCNGGVVSGSARIDIPIIVNPFFLQDVQISMSIPRNIHVFQWNRERFFLRHVELNLRFIVMTLHDVTLDRPEIGTGPIVIFGFCRLRLSRFAMKFSAEIFVPYG